MDQECFGCFLERLDGMRLPSKLGADVCGKKIECDLADKAREGEFRYEKVVRALVSADFFECYRAGLVATAAA